MQISVILAKVSDRLILKNSVILVSAYNNHRLTSLNSVENDYLFIIFLNTDVCEF